VKIPGFIARQFYVEGSLRNTDHGFQLQAQNPMGDGVLVGVGRLRVDGRDLSPDAVTAQRPGDATPINARDVDATHPIAVVKGDCVTLHVEGDRLPVGQHQLEVELFERNLGQLSFSISDRISG
jgi:hypothetical protein